MNQVNKEILKSIALIKTLDDNTLFSEFCFSPDFIGFKGHFEDQPTVPGICLLEMVKTVLQKYLQCTCAISEVKVAKFFSPIGPSEKVSITITNEKPFAYSEECKEIIIKSDIKKNNVKAAFFKLKFYHTRN
jgi:3-hydroxymyristoyl/3-hydroxydecanoyl-(acyl carrier protein) dehydratase